MAGTTSTWSTLLLALAAAVSQASGAALAIEVDLALHDDDQCIEGLGSCTLQALQMKSSKGSADSSVHVNCHRGSLHAWRRDLSSGLAKVMASRLAPLQKPIEKIAQDLALLDEFVNGTILIIENATGEKVTFETEEAESLREERLDGAHSEFSIGLVGPRDEDLDDDEDVDTWNTRALPPHAAFVNKIDTYLGKEIKQLWKAKTLVDRKRMGILDMMGSHPYGPHGEHPEEWKPRGFFPCSNCSGYSTAVSAVPGSAGPDDEGLQEVAEEDGELEVKLGSSYNKHALNNFYQCRLEQDYLAITNSVRDLKHKVFQLKMELQTTQAAVRRFCNSLSGVYQPCPKNICLQK